MPVSNCEWCLVNDKTLWPRVDEVTPFSWMNTRVLFTTSFHTACCVGRNGDGASLGKANESPLLYGSVSAVVLPVVRKPRGSQLISGSSDAGDTSPVQPGLCLSTRLAHQSFQRISSSQIDSSFYLSVYKLIRFPISRFSAQKMHLSKSWSLLLIYVGFCAFKCPGSGLTLGSI